ncbi:MAG: SRPBCC domain-containing protein [Hyphomonadaceae bacterium]|nr:SRPBCC domain-containing protein [Hyphomonadaceae bacterium]
MKSLYLAALLACSACATSPAATMSDTSFVMADGSRAIQLSGWLPASPAEVYRTITTAEGWKTWAVPVAFGGGGVGSFMETSYDPAAKPGDAGNIMQQFIALIPDRLVVFRTTKTPAGFPNADLYMKTIAIMELAPEASGTRLTFTHEGFGKEPGFDQLYGFFLEGDAQTLEALQKVFAP